MTTISKRFTIAGALALLLVIVALSLARSGSYGYRAESLVLAKPYTDALFAPSFEANFIRAIPSAVRVTTLSGTGTGAPAGTNGVVIRIVTVGSTAKDAQRAASEAAEQACRTVLTNYGVKGLIIERASRARSYSYFHDSFKPAISRFLSR